MERKIDRKYLSQIKCLLSLGKIIRVERLFLTNWQSFFNRKKGLPTPSNSEIICVQNVGAKVEMVSYSKKINEN